jgi:hypothetical protein
MLFAGKLIRLIESHEEDIANQVIRKVRRDPHLTHLAAVPEGGLGERAREILKNLGHWLESKEEIGLQYESIGRSRYDQSVPLHEAIGGLCLIKTAIFDFIHEQATEGNCMELYVEEELERRVGRFFDLLVIRMATGYEVEWRHAMQVLMFA